MAPAFKGRIEPGANRSQAFWSIQDPPAQDQDVGIVVLFGHAGHEHIRDQRGPDTGKLVGGNRHADAGAADQDPDSALPSATISATF